MKKIIFLLLIILISLYGFWVWRRFTTTPLASSSLLTPTNVPSVQIGSTRYLVEIRDDDAERAQGLSGKTSLAQGEGMLFLFPQKSQYSFWMKDMQFPIDMIWIADDTIVDISENVPIPVNGDLRATTRRPKVAVDKVLEINAGEAKKNNLRINDKIIIRY